MYTHRACGEGGIYAETKTSILGEGDEINSLVASRSRKLAGMIIDANVLMKDKVRGRLALDQQRASM